MDYFCIHDNASFIQGKKGLDLGLGLSRMRIAHQNMHPGSANETCSQ